MNKIINSNEFKDWKEIRNILVHRTTPGRLIYMGGEKQSQGLCITIPINKNTTNSRYKWLVKTISTLIKATDDFTENYI